MSKGIKNTTAEIAHCYKVCLLV